MSHLGHGGRNTDVSGHILQAAKKKKKMSASYLNTMYQSSLIKVPHSNSHTHLFPLYASSSPDAGVENQQRDQSSQETPSMFVLLMLQIPTAPINPGQLMQKFHVLENISV